MASTLPATPRLRCDCGQEIDIPGRRVGDSIRCGGCGRLRVVVRSKVQGEVPAAAERADGLSQVEREEVDAALRRIKLRRVGQSTRHVQLYPTWAVFLAGVQFYLAGILAGENLIALGEEKRGRRLQVTGVVAYLTLGSGLLALNFLAGSSVPWPVLLGLACAIPLVFAIWFTRAQLAPAQAAREAGAQNAPVTLPLLLGLILAIAQAFAVWFLRIHLEGRWL